MPSKAVGQARFVDSMQAAADFLGPGAIEINRYQAEITDLVRRRFPLGQRISQTPATGQPSRYFEQTAIATAAETDPRAIVPAASQPTRQERVLTLKALATQLNYSLFDVEVNQQQGQFSYLEAKDLTDAVDGVLKLHDQRLWNGNDTDLAVPTTTQYFGISGQITRATSLGGVNQVKSVASGGSLVDAVKTQIAVMVDRTDFEVKPSAFYLSARFADLFDQEAKTLQLYMNEVEVSPGVVVKSLPTQAGSIPLIPDPAIGVIANGGLNLYTGFVLSEEMIEYHYLTSAMPRVFQLGLVGNLAAQFVVIKFGGVVAKAPAYAHSIINTNR